MQNYEKAFEYYKLSTDQDNAYACYETAKMLREGIGIENDAEQAEDYFRNAYSGFSKIANDNPDDKIIYRLGLMIFSGTGCDADRDLGIEYIKQSAELGNEHAQAFWKTATDTLRPQRRAPCSPCCSRSANLFPMITIAVCMGRNSAPNIS